MAFGRLERTQGSTPVSEINMTPLIDVMLVLLVIFMLTAPLMTSSLQLDLPRTQGTRPQPAEPAALRLSLDASGAMRLDDEVLDMQALAARLAPLAGSDVPVHLRADKAVPYGQVAELLGLLQQMRLHRIAFMAEAGTAAPGTSGTPVPLR